MQGLDGFHICCLSISVSQSVNKEHGCLGVTPVCGLFMLHAANAAGIQSVCFLCVQARICSWGREDSQSVMMVQKALPLGDDAKISWCL